MVVSVTAWLDAARRFCSLVVGMALYSVGIGSDIVSSCRCGACEMRIQNVQRTQQTIDCHCAKCRKFHGGAFTSFLEASDDQVQLTKQLKVISFPDSCSEVGSVDRMFCSLCKSKLASKSSLTSTWYINLGTLADKVIRADYSSNWRVNRVSKQIDQAALWYPAKPSYDCRRTTTLRDLTGGCACGKARFSIKDWDLPNELPHCYCHLCREMSGSPFISWIWASPDRFEWLTEEPPLLRTTDFGRRHVCDTCGACLTILYDDEDDDCVYPTAGSIDALPNVDDWFSSVTHIYCRDKGRWYDLPNDGLPRYYE